MPASAIHECIGKIINKELHRDEIPFLLGNIAPDCWRNTQMFGNRNLSHFTTDTLIKEDYKKFYSKYKENLDNPFILGYLTHLLADYYWRDNVQKDIESNLQDKDEFYLQIDKYKLVSFLSRKYNLPKLPKIDCNNFENPIAEIDITGLNGTIDYANKINFSYPDELPEAYDITKTEDGILRTAKFIIEELNTLTKMAK